MLRQELGTLREALRLLGRQGLVERSPRRGVRVAELAAREVDELFSLRNVRSSSR